jgi:predicted amidophosphoribosyltransferase
VHPEGAAIMACAAFAVDSLFLDVLAASKYRRCRPVGGRLSWEAAAVLAPHLPPGALVPVPLRPDKRRERGFNQTEDFARILGSVSGRSVETSWLVRRRGGPALAGLPRDARERAVRGAFVAGSTFAGAAAGDVVLVDDVVTTGSTALSCAAALRAAGAKQVRVASMGRAFAASLDSAARDLVFLGRF